MKKVVKIVMFVVYGIVALIKLPFTLVSALVQFVEYYSVMFLVWIVKCYGSESLIGHVNIQLWRNKVSCEELGGLYEELEIEEEL